MMKEGTTHGLELEHLITDPNGDPFPLRSPEFNKIKELIGEGEEHKSTLGGKEHVIGLKTKKFGEIGLDAAMSLAEHAVKPTEPGDTRSLNTLAKRVLHSLAITNRAIMELHEFEVSPSISMSMHPFVPRDMETYRQLVTPKPVYEIVWRRGWQHNAGIHCAHTSPWTSVEITDVVDLLNTTLAFSGPCIAIFGNSPFQEGYANGVKENRQNMWMMFLGKSKFNQDLKLIGMPEEQPTSLAHYFHLMYQAPVLVVTAEQTTDYKTSGLYTVDGDPNMIDFLAKKRWTGLELGNPGLSTTEVTPSVSHFELQQFMNFWGARVRYALKDADSMDPKELRYAILSDQVENYLEPHLTMMCIEARDYGTALPDSENPDIYTALAPSAIQTGLHRNLKKAKKYAESHPWDFWKNTREVAISKGLEGEYDGHSILRLARDIVAIAAEGLHQDEQVMIQPAINIVTSGKSRSDILLEEFATLRNSQTDSQAIRQILNRHRFPVELVTTIPDMP